MSWEALTALIGVIGILTKEVRAYLKEKFDDKK
jgi:hypothetical protein